MTARALRHAHLALAGVWALLLIPTLLWWSQSILWIAAISLYANAASHLASWQATRAEEASE